MTQNLDFDSIVLHLLEYFNPDTSENSSKFLYPS